MVRAEGRTWHMHLRSMAGHCTDTASFTVNVLNVNVESSFNKSSELVGMVTRPPKSVRCVLSQYRLPSGAPPGGGEVTTPAELHAFSISSQYWQTAPVEQLTSIKPSLHTHAPSMQSPLPEQ